MNVDRHMRRINRMLLAELGENPLYAWVYSESTEFLRPMRAMDEDGNLKWNYRCPCGLNVWEHKPECAPYVLDKVIDLDTDLLVEKLVPSRTSCLTVVEPVWEARKILPEMTDQWVLCCRQLPMSEIEWVQVFGSILPYPAHGSWAPVQTETRTVAMPPDKLPGEVFNMAIIRGRQHSREIKERDITNATEYRHQRQDARRKIKISERLRDCLPVRPNPGLIDGPVSFGGDEGLSPTLRRKIEQGESLVTL